MTIVIYSFPGLINKTHVQRVYIAQSARAVECTDCTSEEG